MPRADTWWRPVDRWPGSSRRRQSDRCHTNPCSCTYWPKPRAHISSRRCWANDRAAPRCRCCWFPESAPPSAPCNTPRWSRRVTSRKTRAAWDHWREFFSQCASKLHPRKFGGIRERPFSAASDTADDQVRAIRRWRAFRASTRPPTTEDQRPAWYSGGADSDGSCTDEPHRWSSRENPPRRAHSRRTLPCSTPSRRNQDCRDSSRPHPACRESASAWSGPDRTAPWIARHLQLFFQFDDFSRIKWVGVTVTRRGGNATTGVSSTVEVETRQSSIQTRIRWGRPIQTSVAPGE